MTRVHRGVVRGGDGRPVAGAAVMVERGDAPTPEVAVVSDGEGCFGLSLPTGRFTVGAYAGDGRSGRVAVVVEDDRRAEIEITVA